MFYMNMMDVGFDFNNTCNIIQFSALISVVSASEFNCA